MSICISFIKNSTKSNHTKINQTKPNQTNPIRSVSVFLSNLAKKGKKSDITSSLCILMWLTNHTHTHFRRKSSCCEKVLRKEKNLHFLVWYNIHIERVCVRVYVTFPNWPLWCHIHSKSIFFFTFFFIVNVKLSHFSYCSTHFRVILAMTLPEHTFRVATIGVQVVMLVYDNLLNQQLKKLNCFWSALLFWN